MIKVETTEQPKSNDTSLGSLGERLKIQSANLVVQRMAQLIEEKSGNNKCKIHPESVSIIKLIADSSKPNFYRAEKHFCCADFSNTIQIEE